MWLSRHVAKDLGSTECVNEMARMFTVVVIDFIIELLRQLFLDRIHMKQSADAKLEACQSSKA